MANICKKIDETATSSNQYYFDKTLSALIGHKLLAVYLDNNQWFGGIFGFDSSTGHSVVMFYDVGSNTRKVLNDTTHTFTYVYI